MNVLTLLFQYAMLLTAHKHVTDFIQLLHVLNLYFDEGSMVWLLGRGKCHPLLLTFSLHDVLYREPQVFLFGQHPTQFLSLVALP